MSTNNNRSQLLGDLLFPRIFRTFRMAIQPTKLIIAFLALVVICLAGWIMDFSKPVVVAPGTQARLTELNIYMTEPKTVKSYIEKFKGEEPGVGVFSTLWHFAAGRFKGAVDSVFALDIPGVAKNIRDFFKALGWALRYHTVYCIIFFLIILAVISIAGGSMCRIAALQFAQNEKPGLTEALRFSTKRFTSFFTAPLAPVGIIIFIGLFILLLGLIGNIPIAGELIAGIFIPLALIAGTLIAIVLIGAFAGFNLMFPAVAYDGSDCFDAISRSFNYIYAKPWHMGFYTAIAAVYGAICYTFVRFFAFLLLSATYWFLQLGIWVDNSTKEVNKLTAIWPEPHFMDLLGSSGSIEANWSEWFAAFVIYLFALVVVGLVVSFIMSFYFSANTIIYSLLRKKVDDTALEDIYTHIDETEAVPTPIESEPEVTPSSSESETLTDSTSPSD